MAVRTRRIAQQQAQLLAIGQQPQPFAARQQHALRTAHRTEAIGAAGAMRRIEIGAGGERPGAQPRTARRLHQPAAILHALACRHVVLPRRRDRSRGASANGAMTWLHTLCGPPLGAQLSPQRAPVPLERLRRDRLASSPSLSQLARQFERARTVPAAPDQGTCSPADRGSRRARHQHQHADRTQNRRRQRRHARVLGAAPLEQLDALLPASRRRAGGLPASAANAASRSSGADSNRQSGPAAAAPNRSPVCGTNAPQMSSARRRSQSCRSLASRSVLSLMVAPRTCATSCCIAAFAIDSASAWRAGTQPANRSATHRRRARSTRRCDQFAASAPVRCTSAATVRDGNSTAMTRWNSMRTALRISALKVSSTASAAPSSARATLTRLSHAASGTRCTREIARRTTGCARPRNASERPCLSRNLVLVAREAEHAMLAIESRQIVESRKPVGGSRSTPRAAALRAGFGGDRRSHEVAADRCDPARMLRCRAATPPPSAPRPHSARDRPASHGAPPSDRIHRTPDRSRAAGHDTHPRSASSATRSSVRIADGSSSNSPAWRSAKPATRPAAPRFLVRRHPERVRHERQAAHEPSRISRSGAAAAAPRTCPRDRGSGSADRAPGHSDRCGRCAAPAGSDCTADRDGSGCSSAVAG